MKHVAITVDGPGNHLRKYRAGGISAGHGLCKDMIKRCGPGGDLSMPDFVKAATVATVTAYDQMHASGTTQQQIEAWSEGFNSTLKIYEGRLNGIARAARRA